MATIEKPLNNQTAQTINKQLREPWISPKPNVHPTIFIREKTPVEIEREEAQQKLANESQVQI